MTDEEFKERLAALPDDTVFALFRAMKQLMRAGLSDDEIGEFMEQALKKARSAS